MSQIKVQSPILITGSAGSPGTPASYSLTPWTAKEYYYVNRQTDAHLGWWSISSTTIALTADHWGWSCFLYGGNKYASNFSLRGSPDRPGYGGFGFCQTIGDINIHGAGPRCWSFWGTPQGGTGFVYIEASAVLSIPSGQFNSNTIFSITYDGQDWKFFMSGDVNPKYTYHSVNDVNTVPYYNQYGNTDSYCGIPWHNIWYGQLTGSSSPAIPAITSSARLNFTARDSQGGTLPQNTIRFS